MSYLRVIFIIPGEARVRLEINMDKIGSLGESND